MQSNRRVFLKGSMAASAVGLAVGAGLLTPRAVMAAAWPETAYNTKGFDESLKDSVRHSWRQQNLKTSL